MQEQKVFEMQEQKVFEHQAGFTIQLPPGSVINMTVLLLLIIGSSMLLYSSSSMTRTHSRLPLDPVAHKTVAFNGAKFWDDDTTATAPVFNFSRSNTKALKISPLFERYYHSHNIATSLGTPLTVAIPTEQGWIQFFDSGALLLPNDQQLIRSSHRYTQPKSALIDLINPYMIDPRSGIIRIPLLPSLLTYGSLVSVGGDASHLSYVDLRNATNPDHMQPDPEAGQAHALSSTRLLNVFVKEGTRDGSGVGHLIPQSLWNYINRVDVSPDGWETDFGAPLTEAISFDIMKSGSVHRMLVQVFSRNGLLLDEDSLDAEGQPEIQLLDIGAAYLQTFGPPQVVIKPGDPIWVQGDGVTTIFTRPGNGRPVVHVGQNFPLSLLGESTWSGGMLWYHVRWAVEKSKGSGWVPAASITFSSPGNVASMAGFDVLSPDLAAYLANIGDDVGAVVYDVTRQRYYSYNADDQFITGSSIKVPIMLTFLNMIEQQHRQPSGYESNLLTTMIENSNNDSAGILYNTEVGDSAGVASYMQMIGLTGLNPYPAAFGWSLISPMAMVHLLTKLYEGKILTAQDRNQALNLMENIEYDQQVGVGDTAPNGAKVAMKDGWVIGPDGSWAMNSSGIVTVGHETYIISVYTTGNPFLGDEQAIARHVCSTIASLLT
jgi:beta-lactamase class A